MRKQLPLQLWLMAAAFALGIGGLSAQELLVRGTVTSAETGQPLHEASVMAKGTEKKTLTGKDGSFEISVQQGFFTPAPPPILIFSMAGYETLELKVLGKSKVEVELNARSSKLSDIILSGTAAGQAQPAMSYSVGAVDEELLGLSAPPYLANSLQGKVAGLQANPIGGQPGQDGYLQLRSVTSLANGQQPLIIVDGIFMNDGSALADINPDDIEKIEVLKGATAAALYGSQGANGVVQLFTRRGRGLAVGDTRVTYRGEVGYSDVPNTYPVNTATNREVETASGPQPVLGSLTADEVYDSPLPNLQDYQKDILFRKGAYQSNYLSVQGRAESTNFMVSAHRLRDEGALQGFDGYTRHNFRANLEHQLSNRFSLQVSSMYTSSTQDLLEPATNGAGSFLANSLLLTPMFGLDAGNEEDDSNYDWDIDNTGMGVTNPLYWRENSRQALLRRRLMGSVGASYRPKKWLTLSYAASLNRSSQEYEHFVKKGFLSSSRPGLFGAQATAGEGGSNGGAILQSQRVDSYFTSMADATLQKKFSGFNLALRGGFLYEDFTLDYAEGRGENLAFEGVRSLDNAQSNIKASSLMEEAVAYSTFLVGDADYQKKYIFSGLFRREESSLFGPEERWHNYYRLAGAYRLTEDIKMKFFQELKLRAAMGSAGNRPAFGQRFESIELINGAVAKNTLGNDFLKPSRTTEMEVGIDATFLKGFTLEFNYVKSSTEDLILLMPLSGSSSFSGQWQNAGKLEATIYEGALHTDFARLFKVKNSDFRWGLTTTFNRMEPVVTQLGLPAYTTGPGLEHSSLFRVEEGRSPGTMVGEVFATDLSQLLEQADIDPNDYTLNSLGYVVRRDQLGTPEERPYRLMDEDGNPLVEPIGNINPDFRMGFANIIAYKGLKLYTLFDWKKGGSVYNLTRQYLYGNGRHGDLSSYPEVAAGFFEEEGLFNNGAPNNHFVEDGSFFMLREASLSYTLESRQLQNLLGGFIESIQFSLIGRNLFTKTNYSGFHPDVAGAPALDYYLSNRFSGQPGSEARTPKGDPGLFLVDAFNYPLRRSFSFSLQMTF
ncbi:MAG: SusC/RagA family TonB-linked outer membrane protein [Phaeodactylibacter sp.]|nr:SusC/RagA family TonB-linked outer membrane protein [Phaeodactylibacter sp.]MCB9295869.1 SusC/RagA family TonB-linked outer membrane protein [Lewinellaceae bacterium]